MAGLEYNKSIFAEYQRLERDVDLARRYEAKATQLLDSVDDEHDATNETQPHEEVITLGVIRDFEDNCRDVCSRIRMANCSRLHDELCELNLWRSSYSRLVEDVTGLDHSQTEPPLSQAKGLLRRADDLKVEIKRSQIIFKLILIKFAHLCDDVQSLRERVEKAEAWIDKLAKVFLKRSQFYWSLREGTDLILKIN